MIVKKGPKTTLVAVLGAAIGIGIFIFFFLGKIDREDLTIAVAGLGTLIAMINGLLAKDADQSHTKE